MNVKKVIILLILLSVLANATLNNEIDTYRTMKNIGASIINHRSQCFQSGGQVDYTGASVHKDRNTMVLSKMEILPWSINISVGHSLKGTKLSLFRNDGKGILILSELKNNSHLVVIDTNYNLSFLVNVSLYLTVSKNVTVEIYSFNQSTNSYMLLYNVVADMINKTFHINSTASSFPMRIRLEGNTTFNVSIYHMFYMPCGEFYFPLYRSIDDDGEICYYLELSSVNDYTKIYLLNLSYLVALKYSSKDIGWNYSERSIIVIDGGDIEIVLKGYDYWNVDKFVSITPIPKIDNINLSITDIDILYRETRTQYRLNDSDYWFSRRIVVHNPNTYFLKDVPVKIELNDSWFNMLALREYANNIRFFINRSGGLQELDCWLEYWDGVKAIYYVKIPELGPYEEKQIIIIYGNPEAPSVGFNENASKMGTIYSMANLAKKNRWQYENGDILINYYDYSNTTSIYLTSYTSWGNISLRDNITGRFRLKLIIESQILWITDPQFSLYFYPIYIDDAHYYKVVEFNNSQGEVYLYVLARNGSNLMIIDAYYIDNFQKPRLFICEYVNHLSGWIKLILTTFDTTYELNFDDIYGYTKQAWRIGWGFNNMERCHAEIYEWALSPGLRPKITRFGYEELVNLTVIATNYTTDWYKLETSTLSVSLFSNISFIAHDVFGNEVLNETIYVLREGPYYLEMNASIINIITEENQEVIIVDGSKYVSLSTAEKIVLAKKTYVLIVKEKMNTELEMALMLRKSTYNISLQGLMDSIDSFENDIVFLYQNLSTIDNVDQADIHVAYYNFSSYPKLLSSIIGIYSDCLGSWEDKRQEIANELMDLESIITALNLSYNGNPELIVFKCQGNITEITIVEGSLETTYFISGSFNNISKQLMNEDISILNTTLMLYELLSCEQVDRVKLDKNDRSVVMDSGDNKIIFFPDTGEITSNYRSPYTSYMMRFLSDSANMINAMYSIPKAPLMMTYTQLNITMYSPYHYICVDSEGNLSWLMEIDTYNYIVSGHIYQYDKSFTYNVMRNVLYIGDIGTVDMQYKKSISIMNPSFNGAKNIVSEDIDIKEWVESNIVIREIRVLDYYTMEFAENEFVDVYVNGSEIGIEVKIVTIRGNLHLLAMDIWKHILFDQYTDNISITIKLRLGELIIINKLDRNVSVNITSMETSETRIWVIGSTLGLKIDLPLERQFKISISTWEKTIIEQTIVLNVTKDKPQKIIILEEKTPATEPSNEQYVELTITETIESWRRKAEILYLAITMAIIAIVLGLIFKTKYAKSTKR